jgi:hypothetical protein
MDWLAQLLGTPTKEYTRFEAGLSLMGVLPPPRVVELLHQRASALQRKALELESVVCAVAHNGIPRVFLVEMDYERALVDAELMFTQHLAADIESGELDGFDLWQSRHDAPAVATQCVQALTTRSSKARRPSRPRREREHGDE